MNKVLIAEDEKMIRRGLKVLVERSSIPVEEVLEARNGEEALEILKNQKIDLLITDVRMPRMDGMELVKVVGQLPHPPKVLVVSGYDDFNYAVTMLRSGAHDYLLKPVQREDFYKALKKIQMLLDTEDCCIKKRKEACLMTLQFLMLNSFREEGEYQALLSQARETFPQTPYRVVCTVQQIDGISGWQLCFRAEGGLNYYIVYQQQISKEALPQISGCSESLTGLESLNKGYHQSMTAWKYSFIASHPWEYEDTVVENRCTVTAEQLLHQTGLSHEKEVIRLLNSAARMVIQKTCSPDALAQLCAEYMERISSAYPNLLDDDASACAFSVLWAYENWDTYISSLGDWLEPFCRRVEQEFLDYENKNKIRRAVQYIQQNYHMPLNMAVVSNQISMNYSLFSLLFKQYTGSNFVTYLQSIRIEEAKKLLLETDWKVNEIGRRVGFSDEKHFLKVFKNNVGFSPSEWRKSHRYQNLE